MTDYPYAVENRVVPGPPIALFRTEEEAEDYASAFLDVRVIPAAAQQKSVITDQQINSMAQYLYEGINLSPDVRLVMDMTSKATLVKVLRQVLIRAGVIGDDRWSIAYMHDNCAQCEQCADLAVESAKRRYLVSDQYTVMIPSGDGTPTVGHRAVVERVL